MSPSAPLTKAGRLSLRGRLEDGRPVKVFEAYGSEHARMIARLSEHAELEGALPAIISSEGSMLVGEWVEEGDGPRPTPEELGSLLARFHRAAPTTDRAGFDYWEDYLLPRGLRALAAVGSEDALAGDLAEARAVIADRPISVLHPDLTSANVIRRPGGELVVVDNELLTVGRTPVLDLYNAARAVKSESVGLVRSYLQAGGIRVSEPVIRASRTMWLIRIVGSHLVGGRLDEVRALVAAGIDRVPLPARLLSGHSP